jgi:hypothetical protein
MPAIQSRLVDHRRYVNELSRRLQEAVGQLHARRLR